MLRIRLPLLAILLTFLAEPVFGLAKDTLKLGEKLEGELTTKLNLPQGPARERYFTGEYGTYVRVHLKAGQSCLIEGRVTGKKRGVRLSLLDPTGKTLTKTNGSYAVENETLSFEAVNVTGKYTVVIGSDLKGPFDLEVTDPNNDEESVAEPVDEAAALEARIRELEAELAESRAKLKVLKAEKTSTVKKGSKASKE